MYNKICNLILIITLMILNGCSWIDDINTIDKKGSYIIDVSSPLTGVTDGAGAVLEKSIECATDHDQGSFEVFDVNNVEDMIWQISMYDQVRNRMDATSLAIDFEPWPQSDPNVLCPTPAELVGQAVEVTLDGCVRASMTIGACSPNQTYHIIGKLTLDAFSDDRRASVKGALDGKALRVRYWEGKEDTTSARTEIGDISASFQFPVHVGVPWMR